MKIYISGPITGIKDKNRDSFEQAATTLRNLGHTAINPFDLDVEGFNPEDCWYKYLKRDLAQLLFCEGVCLLRGWEESKGASLEVQLATQLNIPLYRLNEENELIEDYVAIDIELTPLIPSYLWK